MNQATTPSTRAVSRVRHNLKFRVATVQQLQKIAPDMLRVTFVSPDLSDFVSAAFDDHVKVFFPAPGQTTPTLPTWGDNGPVWPEDQPRPPARDYTPRRFDNSAHTLTIDFALHGVGPAAEWAAQAQVGQVLGLGGPRGSMVIPQDYEWYVLFADETGLPAVGRFLEEMAPATRVIVFAEVATPADEIELQQGNSVQVHWLHRRAGAPGSLLVQAAQRLVIPDGDGFFWAAGESASIQTLRGTLLAHGVDKSRIRASAYWKHDAVAYHANIDD
ncbi:siderophore-interacting protein [Silvimonas sp. JCM 19000]